MNYEQALAFIHSRNQFGIKLGLETTGELLRRLGSPHQKLRFIHVAGTNGKGSVTSYIANALTAAGFRTGKFISPYVHRFTERMQIDNREIPPEALARCTALVAGVLDDTLCPTEFEVVTAIGLLYFLEQQCDYVVLEVGMGGRFDATNVIPAPLVSVITSISIDHTQYLGDTVEQIAFEKCGIVKTGSRLAVYPDQPPEALRVIRETAAARRVPCTVPEKSDISVYTQDANGTDFSYRGRRYRLQMPGMHQVYNAVTAITALELLGIEHEAIRRGLLQTAFRGRFELLCKKPLMLADGAHNHAGAIALKNCLQSCYGGKKLILVMGMLKDKDYARCLAELAPLADTLIATEPRSPRACPAADLAAAARGLVPHIRVLPDVSAAVDYAKTIADDESAICVCGSLYLLGDVKI